MAGRCAGAVDHVREQRRNHYLENRDAILEQNRRSYFKNREARLEGQRRYAMINRESVQEYQRRYRTTPGRREYQRQEGRKYRERKAQATYIDLTHLDQSCYICGGSLGETPHVEHVIPVSRFSVYAAEHEDFSSATRLACRSCNLGKRDKDPAAYMLERFRSGLPIRQAQTVTCSTCPILAMKGK